MTGFLIERKFMATLATATYQIQQYSKDKSTLNNIEHQKTNDNISKSSMGLDRHKSSDSLETVNRMNTMMPNKSFKMDDAQSSPFGKL